MVSAGEGSAMAVVAESAPTFINVAYNDLCALSSEEFGARPPDALPSSCHDHHIPCDEAFRMRCEVATDGLESRGA